MTLESRKMLSADKHLMSARKGNYIIRTHLICKDLTEADGENWEVLCICMMLHQGKAWDDGMMNELF